MGSSCSSGQKHKDNASTRSQESPTYQGAGAHGANHHHAPPPAPTAPAGAAQGGTQPAKPAAPAAPAKAAEPERGVVVSTTSESVVADDGRDVLPPPLDKLADDLGRLLLGRAAASRPAARTNKIAIYVCAADAEDCCVEKGALHRHVYPELRAACRERGYELHVVDLHWRTALERRQDHEFPELCLGELARQQETAYVVPVLFLNTSLGTPLLPNTIESQDFEKALAKADDKGLLTKWYSLDNHAQPPCYRLGAPTRYIPGLQGDCLAEGPLAEWRQEVDRTLAVLQAVLPAELRDTYLSTALEQEVHNTVCMSQEMARRTLWLHRVYTHQPPAAPAAPTPTPQEAELRRRLDGIHQLLKAQLVEKHILRLSVKYCDGGLPPPDQPEHTQYVSDVTAQLASSLRNIVDAIIDEDQARTVGKPGLGLDNRLVLELGHQAGVCQRASQCSVNRDAVIAQVKAFVEGRCRAPLVVTGPRGCGKSTLLARVAECSAAWACPSPTGPAAPLLVLRFCGVSAESMTLERVLASIGQQCQLLWNAGHAWASHTVDSWREKLPELLAGAASKRTLVVMVDGLDLLKAYGTVSADWVPAELPDNVKLIVTLWDGSGMLPALRARLPASAFISMPKLDQTEAAGVLNAWVMQYNHSVPKRVQDCVMASDCTLPLHAKVLAWQTSWEQSVTPRGNVEDQLQLLLDQLEEILGKKQVAHAAALVSAAKYGVSDSEMLDLLAHNAAFHSTETHVPWAPACLFWARFNKLLAPFLQWVLCDGELVLQWKDAAVRDAVDARYKEKEGAAAAKALLDYFQGSWWAERSPPLLGRLQPMCNLANPDKCYNSRRLQELPFQAHAVRGTIKKEFLLDLAWVYDKVCGTDVFQVLEDMALERSSDVDVQWLEATLRDAAPALAFDGRQLHSQLFRRLTLDFPAATPPARTAPGAAPAAPEPAEWVSVPAGRALPRDALAVCVAPPAPALLPIPADVPDDLPDRLDLVVRIRDYPDYVVSVSTAKEEIAVWDILRCERVRVLRGVPQPLSLQPVDSTRCIVLCQRELRIYDLDACTLLAKLKGVMNQKMPYFGLHDQSHLVALSRNRMYVNLMNLDSGDCVTTFKAGEDRFLNSLLVSGDGRVLVCGDETQKPFPLLVWNLASRKLLYDLRIPHHDFVTSLAAITHEGHYVSCVAQEVDEPSANFIVVYDLQSGTLFKKWKPGVNTVSLNISSRDGCVISGLQDGRVLVWDLITGNCRWTLSGHTAPVDYLRLDAQGGTFLSADSKCRDRSLRLWDLNKGTLVAVYTARQPVTACEVTHGGEVLVLGEEGAGHPTTLRLRGRAATTPPGPAAPQPGQPGQPAQPGQPGQPSRYFGQPQNHGRIVDFR